MTTSAAGNLAGHTEKEKTEKRRALGRGLESLLPGPRVVPSIGKVGAASSSATTTGAKAPLDRDSDAALKGRSSTVASSGTVASGGGAIGIAGPVRDGTVESVPAERAGIAPEIPHFSQHQGEVGHPPGLPTRHIPSAALSTASTADARFAGHLDSAENINESQLPDPVPAQTAGTRMGHPRELAVASGKVDFHPYADPTAGPGEPIEIQAVADTRIPSNLVINLAIADIDKNPFQTRYVEDDDALGELADSIKASGVVQPIVVRPAEEPGRYILILGERRLHASTKAEMTHIPALVRRVSDQQAAEMTIVENLQREDLSPLEQAEAFRVLSSRFNMTQQQIAERVGLSRVSVTNYMRLLKLPREVMQMLAEKRINFAQAKELLKLGDNDRIAEAALYAVKKGMNIEQIEMLVLRMDGLLDPLPDMPGVQKKEKTGGARWVDPNVRAAQLDLERMLGVRVRIRDRKGKGKIVIEYSTVDDYERVVEMLRGKK